MTAGDRDAGGEAGLKRRDPGRLGLLLIFVTLVLAVAGSGCARKKVPLNAVLAAGEHRVPLILMPGITGSRLRDRDSGRVVWGTTRAALSPRDAGYGVALSIVPGGRESNLEAYETITHLRLGLGRIEFYGIWQRTLEAHGYVTGDLERPAPGDSFFFHPYDWRRSNTHSAAELLDRLDDLRQARGLARLEVDLVCQSNAARIVRWMLKYGAGSLEEAEAGTAAPPEWLAVRNLFLVGPDNGGSLRNLRDLDRGRRYFPLFGRRFRPEMIFTLPSVFEGLPQGPGKRFVDAEGRALDVDLYDPVDWERHEWSIFDPRARRRIDRSGRDDLFGDIDTRREHLARMLRRARRLQTLLAKDPEGFDPPRYHLYVNGYVPTAQRALLERRDGRWLTAFPDDSRIEGDAFLGTRLAAPGDGHGLLEHQLSLSPAERAAMAGPPVYVDEAHRDVVRRPETLRHVLSRLAESVSRRP